MIVRLRYAEVMWTEDGCFSRFHDGTGYGALPHDVPHYHYAAYRMGYEGDILTYCRHHDVAHHVVAEAFDQPSAVLWALAHDLEPSAFDAAAEEALALALQRYVMCHEVPLIDRVDWQRLRERFLTALETAHEV